MDPVSHFALGATLAAGASIPRKESTRIALLTGGSAALLPDLDVFISSSTDPLLQLEYHRHFTHSLLFIPVGAFITLLLVKCVFPLFRVRQPSNAALYLYALLGYASHGFLDACTSYGTQLLWPFSSMRVAWNIIGIVDPFFTVVILGLLLYAFMKKRSGFARAALIYGLLYLTFGVYQRDKATGHSLLDLQERGVTLSPQGCEAKPAPLSLFLWRTICESDDGRFLVDAWHVSPFKYVKYQGGEIKRFDPSRDAPWLHSAPRQERDLKRFEWFSSGYIVTHPLDPNVVGDIRYSLLPNGLAPLWGIGLDPGDLSESRKTPWLSYRSIKSGDWELFLKMHIGEKV